MENNPIKYSDLIKPDNSIDNLIKQLEQLNDTYGKTIKGIRSEAAMLSETLKKVSGATEDGRKTTGYAAKEADRLQRAVRDVVLAESENAKILAELNLRKKEANDINKLIVKINSSAEGSYNRLSAQYSLNKIYLNNMTKAERENTEEGRKLVAQTLAIYEEMKRLQEVTGKFQLNVGNYADAAKGLGTQIENNTKQLALMRLEGKQNTEEYQKLSKETSILKDAVSDATKEIKNMASDTSTLDSALSLLGGASGGFAAVTGAMELFGGESDSVQEAQRKLQAAIALTNGVQQIQNNIQKQSSLMLGIARIQTYALAKAQEYETMAKKKGTVATVAATVAQKAFNLVAKAHPYVLLATAVISIVGALYLFSKRSKEATEEEKRRQQVMRENAEVQATITRIQQKAIESTASEVVRIKQLTSIINSNTASYNEKKRAMMALEKIVPGFHADLSNELKLTEDNTKAIQAYIKQLGAKAKAQAYYEEMVSLNSEINKAQITADKKAYNVKAVEREMERNPKKYKSIKAASTVGIDYYEYEANKDLIDKREELRTQQQALSDAQSKVDSLKRQYTDLEKRMANDKAIEKSFNDLIIKDKDDDTGGKSGKDVSSPSSTSKPVDDTPSLIRAAERAKIEAMEEGFEKRKALIEHEYKWEIDALRTRLNEDKNLTAAGRDAINRTISDKETQKNNELAELEKTYNEKAEKEREEALRKKQEAEEKSLLREKDILEKRLNLVAKGTAEELKLRLAVLDIEEKIELKKNESLSDDEKIDPNLISSGYAVRRNEAFLDFIPEFAKSNENSDDARLKQLGGYAGIVEGIIGQIESGDISAGQNVLDEFKKRLSGINDEIDKLNTEKMKKVFGEAMGLLEGLNIDFKDSMSATKILTKNIFDLMNAFKSGDFKDKMSAIGASISIVTSALSQLSEARIKEAEAAEQQAKRDVDAAQSVLDKEIEARNNGYAHNVAQAQKDLDLARKTEEKAMRDKRKAQKQQAAIETLEQIGHLVTASALLWKQLGVAAPPMIAVMWASFAASKLMAAKLAKNDQGSGSTESYGSGTVELLSGGSHQSGNDIDLGMKADGTRRRAEGGEFFAVINKRSSLKYRGIIPDVINSLNKGVFMERYMNLFNPLGFNVMMGSDTPRLDDLKKDVREIREQNKRRYYVQDGYVVECYKNLKRRYRTN